LLQLSKIEDDRVSFLFIRATLTYLFQVRPEEAEKINQRTIEILSEQKGVEMLTIVDQWMEKGIEKGMEKGIEKSQKEIVSRMTEKGYDASTIADLTGLSIAHIKMLQHS
jgi:predicted transposase/invertase (TIGR01784 family)